MRHWLLYRLFLIIIARLSFVELYFFLFPPAISPKANHDKELANELEELRNLKTEQPIRRSVPWELPVCDSSKSTFTDELCLYFCWPFDNATFISPTLLTPNAKYAPTLFSFRNLHHFLPAENFWPIRANTSLRTVGYASLIELIITLKM